MIENIIIAIDGHSSTGKSTLAKMLSKHLQYKHINTGLMYRALTLVALRNNWIECTSGFINKAMIIKAVDDLEFDFVCNQLGEYKMHLHGEDVNNELKSLRVSKYVSIISKYSAVRRQIVKIQQQIGKCRGLVMEGRDIGSVVFPDADLKLFITASLEVRAKRRYDELLKLGIDTDINDVLENLKMRDFEDSHRKISPLICVEDAVLIDNTLLSIKEQFERVLGLLKDKF